MVYTRIKQGTIVTSDNKIQAGDVVALCKCGGEIVAIDLDEDDDFTACCTQCVRWSKWIQQTPEPVCEVIYLEDRRPRCQS